MKTAGETYQYPIQPLVTGVAIKPKIVTRNSGGPDYNDDPYMIQLVPKPASLGAVVHERMKRG